MSKKSDFNIEKIDDLIHSRLRLGIMAYLANAESATFSELKAVLNAAAGNLSIQIRKLEDASYIKVDKKFVGRKPQTTTRLTTKGRKAFSQYLAALTDIVGNTLN
ncbi:MAG: transcriptional regulator [Robiginitomaculum sp.]|nr:MAG: transcriptional regulator [Robiginitomaculum sp.]